MFLHVFLGISNQERYKGLIKVRKDMPKERQMSKRERVLFRPIT